MAKTIIGILPDRNHAQIALDELEEKGYNPKDISIILKDEEGKTGKVAGSAAGGTVSGAATGGVVGALAGLLVSAGVFPTLGALFIGGPLAAALGLGGAAALTASGAATGALAGGVLGLLGQLGLSAQDAKNYEKRIHEGGVVVAVPTKTNEEHEVRRILIEHGADQVKSVGTIDDHHHFASI